MPRPAEVPPYGRIELMKEVRTGLKTGTYSMQVANALYIRPARGIIVKVEPCDNGYVDHWSGVLFEVFSRTARVDAIFLPFDGLLARAADDRADYDGGIHIWRQSKAGHKSEEDWYIARPASVAPLVELINDFLLFWGKQEH
jgi:hypothetical protein